MTPGQRRLRAQIAANARWSHPMARADQADAARSAMLARLERQVDPAGELPPEQRSILVRAGARQLSATLNAARTRKRATALSFTLAEIRAAPHSLQAVAQFPGVRRHAAPPDTRTYSAGT